MKADGLKKIMDSSELTSAEKSYIFDFQLHNGGSFTIALFECISLADGRNKARLAKGFPAEVAAVLAWTRGDLWDRASRIAGGDCSFISTDKSRSYDFESWESAALPKPADDEDNE